MTAPVDERTCPACGSRYAFRLHKHRCSVKVLKDKIAALLAERRQLREALKDHAMNLWNGYEQCLICSRIAVETGLFKLVHTEECPLYEVKSNSAK